ncbi:MAG TPA: LLM class flavin-dependent oxidoreductase [Acidimicrobiales bacterium]|nr:LLM class flavin-dependent oxidoreductase [Acidimicrobiales bacterium]
MRFGLFYEHQLPRPWGPDDEHRLMKEALDQVELADRMGFSHIWEVEHHFLEEYSHSSAPEVFLAAASQRTKNIRLGHGIIQTAPAYNHPARTAERVATLDLVSDGRVEFGSGESGSIAELGGFGIDPEDKRAQWREGLEVAIRCLTETPFTGVEGRYVSMPPRNVVPKPHQKPHPPLWVACSRRDTILMAAELGIGALSFAFIDPEEARTWVQDYEKILTESCVPIGLAVNPQLACVTTMMCHPDPEEAIRRGLEGANFFGYSLAHYYVFGDHVPGRTDVWDEFEHKRSEMGYSPEVEVALQKETLGAKIAAGETSGLRGAVGTPDQLREFCRRYEEAGVDQLIFVLQAGRNRHEHIMESIEIFGTEVLPEFAERDPGLTAAKTERLAPAIEAAMARRPDTTVPMPDDYVMPALPRQMILDSGGDELIEEIEKGSLTGRFDTFRDTTG